MEINIENVKKIAREAGNKIMGFYGKDYKLDYKDGDEKNPVTEADLISDKIIRAGLKKYNLPILSEESADDESRLDSEYVWIVDPLDGTYDFIQKTDEFSVLIGLVKNKIPIFGVVYEPVTDRSYWAEKDKGAFVEHEGRVKKIKVSDIDKFSEATILLSRNHLLDSEVEFCERAGIKNRLRAGSAGLKICRIAEGKAEIYVSFSHKVSEWDTCAGKVILEEAGGIITDMSGSDLTYNNSNPKHLNGFVASNRSLHEKI